MLSLFVSIVLAVPAECKECKPVAIVEKQKTRSVTRGKLFNRKKSCCK